MHNAVLYWFWNAVLYFSLPKIGPKTKNTIKNKQAEQLYVILKPGVFDDNFKKELFVDPIDGFLG